MSTQSNVKYGNMSFVSYSNNYHVSGTNSGVTQRHIVKDKSKFDPNNDGYL